MEAVDILGLLVPVTYLFFLATERIWPARTFPPRPHWQWIGIVFLVLTMTLGVVAPLVIPIEWLDEHRWFDGRRLGVVGGTLVGFVLLEGVIYVYHRSCHHVPILWRALHQVHHGPGRIDIPGSLVFHPLEMFAQVLLMVFATVIVLGVEPLAGAIIGYLVSFNSLFQHWNVRTPQWVGYIFQRPESHCVHHRLGLHYYNFSDFPLWDMVFGTFRNPREFHGECGFEAGADRKLGSMLAFADVNESMYGPGSMGQKAGVARTA